VESRSREALLGKMPATFALRSFSAFTLSRALVERMERQCSVGNAR